MQPRSVHERCRQARRMFSNNEMRRSERHAPELPHEARGRPAQVVRRPGAATGGRRRYNGGEVRRHATQRQQACAHSSPPQLLRGVMPERMRIAYAAPVKRRETAG